ncbi:MAG: hypothetical protein QE487_12775 [Fluviicola sp.]|nr:hypothetical protein [Fluviicola sp.]
MKKLAATKLRLSYIPLFSKAKKVEQKCFAPFQAACQKWLFLCFKVKSGRSGSETQRTADLAIAVRFSAFDKTQRNSHFFWLRFLEWRVVRKNNLLLIITVYSTE